MWPAALAIAAAKIVLRIVEVRKVLGWRLERKQEKKRRGLDSNLREIWKQQTHVVRRACVEIGSNRPGTVV